MPPLHSFLPLWPYAFLTVALLVSLATHIVVRKRYRRKIAQLSKEIGRQLDHIAEEEQAQARDITFLREQVDKSGEWGRMHYEKSVLLSAILTRLYPYSRLIINDPTKLSAWLEKLKRGRKKTVKKAKV